MEKTNIMNKNSKVKVGCFDHFDNSIFFLKSKRSVTTDSSDFNTSVFSGEKRQPPNPLEILPKI